MTITLRATKGSPLTHGEMDDNLVTLRDVASQTSGSINNVIIGASTAAAGNFTSLTAAAGNFTSLTAGEGAFSGDVTIANSSKLKNATTPSRNYLTVATNELTLSADANIIVWNGSAFYPGNNNIRTNGSATNRWANVYTANLDASGNVTLGDASTDTVTVNGYMGVGGAGGVNVGLSVVPTALAQANQYGAFFNPTGSTAGTANLSAAYAWPVTSASAYTVAKVAAFEVGTGTKGAGSTATNWHGLYIADQTQGTNNYGITSAVSSGTNKWNIYASGTAANYFAGTADFGASYGVSTLRLNGAIVAHPADSLAHVGRTGSTGSGIFAEAGHLYLAARADGTNRSIIAATGGTERLRIDSAGNAKFANNISVGGATVATSGTGITFPATQSSSSDANTLDDYDEYTAASTACTGAITTACVWKLTKTGNSVTLTLPAVQGNGVATTNFTVGLTIPAKYRPAADFASVSAPIINNAAKQSAPGMVKVTSAGVISVWLNGTESGNFTVTANAGLAYTTSISWTI